MCISSPISLNAHFFLRKNKDLAPISLELNAHFSYWKNKNVFNPPKIFVTIVSNSHVRFQSYNSQKKTWTNDLLWISNQLKFLISVFIQKKKALKEIPVIRVIDQCCFNSCHINQNLFFVFEFKSASFFKKL